jgi:protein-disulfide isomerase
MDNYVRTAKVKFLFKDFVINDRPFDKGSTLASSASYCATDQGKYRQCHDELFDNSQGENSAWVTQQRVMQFAKNVQVPINLKFSKCLNSQQHNNIVIQNTRLIRSLEIDFRSTFFLLYKMKVKSSRHRNGEVVHPYESFKEMISQLQKS